MGIHLVVRRWHKWQQGRAELSGRFLNLKARACCAESI